MKNRVGIFLFRNERTRLFLLVETKVTVAESLLIEVTVAKAVEIIVTVAELTCVVVILGPGGVSKNCTSFHRCFRKWKEAIIHSTYVAEFTWV
jgi:hypothetical protein